MGGVGPGQSRSRFACRRQTARPGDGPVASGAVMSAHPHSAELGFTLIKGGLPKSASSSLAPLQPRVRCLHNPSASPPPSFAPLFTTRRLGMPLTFNPIQKKENTLICLPSCLSPFHRCLRVQKEAKKRHQNTDKLFRVFFPLKRDEKMLDSAV